MNNNKRCIVIIVTQNTESNRECSNLLAGTSILNCSSALSPCPSSSSWNTNKTNMQFCNKVLTGNGLCTQQVSRAADMVVEKKHM